VSGLWEGGFRPKTEALSVLKKEKLRNCTYLLKGVTGTIWKRGKNIKGWTVSIQERILGSFVKEVGREGGGSKKREATVYVTVQGGRYFMNQAVEKSWGRGGGPFGGGKRRLENSRRIGEKNTGRYLLGKKGKNKRKV